jgi:hypothetical protein
MSASSQHAVIQFQKRRRQDVLTGQVSENFSTKGQRGGEALHHGLGEHERNLPERHKDRIGQILRAEARRPFEIRKRRQRVPHFQEG